MVIPANTVNANDMRRGSGGTALRWRRISDANDATISTKHAYARVMVGVSVVWLSRRTHPLWSLTDPVRCAPRIPCRGSQDPARSRSRL